MTLISIASTTFSNLFSAEALQVNVEEMATPAEVVVGKLACFSSWTTQRSSRSNVYASAQHSK